jgi:hypothetical protein
MDLRSELEHISTKEDLARFVDLLRKDFLSDPDSWENADIASFLEALAAWLRDMDGYYEKLNQSIEQPSWKIVAEILLAARIYE